MINLKDKKILVTGGSRGIGKEIVNFLLKAGAEVMFTYHSSYDKANETLKLFKKAGFKCFMTKSDVSDLESNQQLYKEVQEKLGGLDILINNAGITKDNLLLRMTLDQFDSVVKTNLRGVWMTSKVFLKMLLRSSNGKIINIASVSGIMGNAGQSNYSSAKAGVIGLTKSIAREYASKGLKVNAVAPGFTVTDMTERLNENQIQLALKSIPLGKMGSTEDIAGAVLFLASDLSNYITGQTIVVDGGMVMPI
tara:strand:+ start:4698 stop:5450 length:753 start_codon:yes stop_codon:yes gene_type:complete